MTVTIEELEKAERIATLKGEQYEAGILKDFIYFMEKRGGLSLRQVQFALHLVEKNSQEDLDKGREFAMQWASDPKLREKYEVIARYYSTTPYYGKAVKSVMKAVREHCAPDYWVCKPMIGNKYAQKVWDSHSAPPKWKVGDMVAFRSNPKGNLLLPPQISRYRRQDGERPYWGDLSFIVVEVDSMPISEAYAYNKTSGGTRWYKLLPVGVPCQVHAMECNLKKVLKKKVT
jgi:hypothetical protein